MAGLFEIGAQFPHEDHIERLAKYKRLRKVYEGKAYEVYERAVKIIKDSPQAEQLDKLHIACNIVDPIVKKPADMLVGERPTFDTSRPSEEVVSQRLADIVEKNNIEQLVHELVIGGGYRGDSWIKVRYGYSEDYSELEALGLPVPTDAEMRPIIEHVDAMTVFPETVEGNIKQFKAINIARLEFVEKKKTILGTVEEVYLNVERHLPGYIIYERYRLEDKSVDTTYGVPISTFYIVEKVPTGRENDIVETGVPFPLVFHIPYTSLDDTWQGECTLEKLESLIAALHDRIAQIDYILWKHSDPQMYGPAIETDESTRVGGRYIEVEKDDVVPGYMTWNSQLDGAFKQLDKILGMIFQIAETPDWLFGTSIIGDGNKAGGTSHTTNAAIKSRYLPIISKVQRIRLHVDKAIRDALYAAQLLENYANRDNKNFVTYEPVRPTIVWKDGIPSDLKELAEIASIRTGGKPTLDVKTAIRRMDDVDGIEADRIIRNIAEDEAREHGFVDAETLREG